MSDPFFLRRAQVSEMLLKDMCLNPFSSEIYSHKMSLQTGLEAITLVQESSKKNEDVNFSWRCKSSDGVQSSVKCLQVFSDKSQTSLESGEGCFYPLHVTLLNFQRISVENIL